MKPLDCPHCKQEATSWVNMGNTFFFLSENKSCAHCGESIRFNLTSIFVAYGIVAVFIYAFKFVGVPLFMAIPDEKRLLVGLALAPIMLPAIVIIAYVFFPFLFRKLGLSFFKMKHPNQFQEKRTGEIDLDKR